MMMARVASLLLLPLLLLPESGLAFLHLHIRAGTAPAAATATRTRPLYDAVDDAVKAMQEEMEAEKLDMGRG